jgi:hypothetical protein
MLPPLPPQTVMMTAKIDVDQGNEGQDLGAGAGLEIEREKAVETKTASDAKRKSDASARKRNENVDARRQRRCSLSYCNALRLDLTESDLAYYSAPNELQRKQRRAVLYKNMASMAFSTRRSELDALPHSVHF